jgi:pyruvate dehydrogenase E2 component (dihydrolipoamide acetyltransferase)
VEEIFVPALGMAMEEATLVDWLKQPGDTIDVGDVIAEIETDKSTLELSATTSGRLGAHRASAGAMVAVGSTVTVVLADGEDEAAAAPSASSPPDGAETAGAAEPQPATPDDVPPPNGRAPHRLSPRQRRLAAEQHTQVSLVPDRAPDSAPDDTAAVRASIGRLVSKSWAEIPHFAVAREVAADGVLDRVSTEPDSGVRVSVTDVLIRALGRGIGSRGPSDVGLAVATRYGVLLPVLPNVAERSLAEIATLRRAAVTRARERRSVDDDTRTPLITLSNLGTHGVRWFTGIIPVGQQGLLTVGTLEQRAVVRSDRLAVGWELSVILNVDHRTWDGADAAELLARFAAGVTGYGAYDDAR